MVDRRSERTVANRLIDGLPERSLVELRQQWLNLVRLMAHWEGKTAPRHLLEFKMALAAEWERRGRAAKTPEDYFKRPSTLARGGDGSLDGGQWHREGLLSFLGYRVGSTAGLAAPARRVILDAIQTSPLPPVNGPSYMREWDGPSTSNRLQKLANELASFTRNAKRKRAANLGAAIIDFEADLAYLFDAYYLTVFGFSWPEI